MADEAEPFSVSVMRLGTLDGEVRCHYRTQDTGMQYSGRDVVERWVFKYERWMDFCRFFSGVLMVKMGILVWCEANVCWIELKFVVFVHSALGADF